MILTVQGDLLVINQADSTEMKQLYRIATGYVPKFIKNAKNKHSQNDWDGSICYLYDGMYMPAGLWRRVLDLQQAKIPYSVQINNMMSLFDSSIEMSDIDDFADTLSMPFDLRNDQLMFAEKIFKAKKSCYKIGTGGGKTALCYFVSRYLTDKQKLKGKTLMIVPSIHLVDQCFDDMEYYQTDCEPNKATFKVYKIHSSARNCYKQTEADLICGTYQSLINMPSDWFEQFDFVITDEAHMAPANSIITIFRHCKNASYRLGLSGSLPEAHTTERLTIESYIGPMLGEFNVADMRDQGIVSDFEIKRVIIKHSTELDDPYIQYLVDNIRYNDEGKIEYSPFDDKTLLLNAEQHHCMHCTPANDIIGAIFANLDKNSIILCKRKDHVNNIANAIQQQIDIANLNKQVHIIKGDVQLSERKDIIALMEAEPDRHIVVATTKCLSTGVSVHAWFYAGFVMLGKSNNTTLQSVGRMLRKHPLKDKAIIIDIAHQLAINDKFKEVPTTYRYSNYDMRHFAVRKQIYERESYEYDKNVQTFQI